MRSKLFVPGVRPELFAKALASAADAISIDLVDAGPADRKAEARAAVAAFLASEAARATPKLIIVRVNALDSAHFEADLQALAGLQSLDLINLPKPESAADIRAAIAALQAAGLPETVKLLANIETPTALRRAHEIAQADPRVAGLQLGLGDLFEPYGIARRDPANVHAALFAVALAAAEAGVFCCDGAFADLKDDEGFRAEARMARALGFIGKSCIHPSQIAAANEVFQPGAGELAHARRVVEAAAAAGAQGRGAFVVDGKMIDLPFLKRAQALLAAAGVESTDAAR
ncbi:HpcH/HpaI aldolase/citrate lyase family protein [Roseateles violae]|uniref:Aldolase/citrate lyase family protein n=1 Tax=Roseateles violae TaxID=3058042 RepID=A0ABT8DTE1_9BURK|nr:aldolase/citrate lyase family protein [Pelomonas sp. PFR6]MDN3921336.1 aldolase/citrate lyase family protein [Pelomonas sp. PFR6]